MTELQSAFEWPDAEIKWTPNGYELTVPYRVGMGLDPRRDGLVSRAISARLRAILQTMSTDDEGLKVNVSDTAGLVITTPALFKLDPNEVKDASEKFAAVAFEGYREELRLEQEARTRFLSAYQAAD